MKAYNIDRWGSLAVLARFAHDPISGNRELHRKHGPFIRIDLPLSPRAARTRACLVADADLYKTLMTSSSWRNVKITWSGLPNHASSRLTTSMTTLQGARHEHYRKMFIAPLKRPVVAAMSPQMARVATDLVAAWPRNRPIDLRHIIKDLTTRLAIALLFGNDLGRALPITDLITRQYKAFRLMPGRDYVRWLLSANRQEREIMKWAEEKRGNSNALDLLSILVNNPDIDGRPPPVDLICGVIGFLYTAAFDTCLNGILWTTLLLTQHPDIMEALTAEIDEALSSELPNIERIGQLPLLENVIREGMRLMPPVPMQMRRTLVPAELCEEQLEPREIVVINSYMINRDPGLYADPDRFVPDRWNAIRPSPFQYTVFGAGGHMCPGVTFGMQMVKISLAAILSAGRLELAHDTRIGYRTAVTLTPSGRVDVLLRNRGDRRGNARASGPFAELVTLPGRA